MNVEVPGSVQLSASHCHAVGNQPISISISISMSGFVSLYVSMYMYIYLSVYIYIQTHRFIQQRLRMDDDDIDLYETAWDKYTDQTEDVAPWPARQVETTRRQSPSCGDRPNLPQDD